MLESATNVLEMRDNFFSKRLTEQCAGIGNECAGNAGQLFFQKANGAMCWNRPFYTTCIIFRISIFLFLIG